MTPVEDHPIWRAYVEHRAGLYAYARAITGNTHAAEDAVHDAVVNVVQARAPARNEKAYLYRAVRNQAFRTHTRNGRERALNAHGLGGLFIPIADVPPDERFAEEETREHLGAALLALGAEEREVIVLHIYSRFKFREIATLLDAPMGTVASRYRRGLEKLAHALKESNHATERR